MKTASRHGVTLTELLLAISLGALVLGAALSTCLFIARSSVRVANYSDMERAATLGLEQMGREVRMAQSIASSGSPVTQVTLTVPDSAGSGTHPVTYA